MQILPAFYAFYQGVLGNVMDAAFTPLPLLVLGGLLITVGAWAGPRRATWTSTAGPTPSPRVPRAGDPPLRLHAVRRAGDDRRRGQGGVHP